MKALDLFCGCGGAGLAMRQAGVQDVVGVDLDTEALAIYSQVVGEVVQGDVTKLEPSGVISRSPDLLWASPPCQPWSEGRRNRGLPWGFDTPEGQLLLEPLRWAKALNPHWVVVENVDGLPDEMLVPLVEGLQALYPHVTILRLNAENWLPQKRGHVFVAAGASPVPVPAGPGGKTFAEIADGRGAEPVQVNHLRYAIRKRYAVPVVTLDGVLPTVATRPYSQRWTAFVMTQPGCLRFPTFLEAARAQGFSDDHPLHDLYRQRPAAAWRLLGNAVPVVLAKAVVDAVLA